MNKREKLLQRKRDLFDEIIEINAELLEMSCILPHDALRIREMMRDSIFQTIKRGEFSMNWSSLKDICADVNQYTSVCELLEDLVDEGDEWATELLSNLEIEHILRGDCSEGGNK